MEVYEAVQHENLFEKVLRQGNIYLKIVGLKLDSGDGKRKFINRLRFRLFYIFHFLFLSLDIFGQMSWLIQSIARGNDNLIDVTFVIPCLTVCLMGYVKSFYFLKNVHHIHDIIATLNKLINKRLSVRTKKYIRFEKKSVCFLNVANKIITWVTILGIITFGIGPLLLTATKFYNTGEIKLFLPFLFYYPFNAFDIRIWPLLYLQQQWSAVITVCTIWGPNYICYSMATFIIIQFFVLKQDIASLISKTNSRELFPANNSHRAKFREIVERHNDLLRCAALIEVTYTNIFLINVVASSVLICFNVFNITASKNIVYMAPYTAFLIIVLGQIFLLCYYGDKMMKSSMEVSDAVYKCHWYGADPAIVRDLIIVSMRTNKPSKLTAYGFSDVNLRTFTKILSTSWSYFALLQTVYNKNKQQQI